MRLGRRLICILRDMRSRGPSLLKACGGVDSFLGLARCKKIGQSIETAIHKPDPESPLAMLILRRATLDDAVFLFDLRNDLQTRTNSISMAAVPWNNHIEWLGKTLNNPARFLFIAVEEELVGTSRLDFTESHAEISYTVAPARHQKGCGHALVRETLKHSAVPVRATVKPHNFASRRILENADFRITGEENGLMVYLRK